jgi:tetratricopeptide (TPR) repeat protein
MLSQFGRKRPIAYLTLICFSIFTIISCSGDKKSDKEINFKKHYDLGSKYYEERKYQEAIKEFEKAANINPKSADSYFKIGQCYRNLVNFEESIKSYEKGLQINPDASFRVFFQLGSNYFKLQKYDESIKNMKKAQKSMTDEYSNSEYSANFVLANSYYHIKDYKNAIKHFNRVLELKPDYELAYFLLSQSHITKGNQSEAKQILEKGLKQRPNSLSLMQSLSWLLSTSTSDQLRDGQRAIILGERAVDFTEGKNHNYLDTLAAAYAELGQYDNAVKSEEKAINILTNSSIPNTLNDSLLSEYQERLSSYKTKKPWRE